MIYLVAVRQKEKKLTFVGSAVVGDVLGCLDGSGSVVGSDVVGDTVGFLEGDGVGGTDGGFGVK